MRRKTYYKISSLLMATVIFISSLGYSLDLHFCGDSIFDFSLTGIADSCQKPVKNKDVQTLINISCCDFGHYNIETSDEYSPSSMDKVYSFLLSFLPPQMESISYKENNLNSFYLKDKESPPLIVSNKIYVVFESFLI